MNKILYHKKDGKCQLICDSEVLQMVRFAFSAPNEAKKYARPDKRKFIPDRNYWVSIDGKFAIGLLNGVLKVLKDNNETYEFDQSLSFVKSLRKEVNNIGELITPTHSLRDYQRITIERCLKFGYGLLELATGAGKTYVMANLIYNLFDLNWNNTKKVLVIVPTKGLLTQTYDEFISFGIPKGIICRYGDGYDVDLNCNVIISTSKILLSDARDNSWVKNADYLIVDEVHTLKRGNEIQKVVKNMKTFHKWGFTGTIPKERENFLTIRSMFGDILYKKSSAELRDEGVLSEVCAEIIQIQHKIQPPYVNSYERATDNWNIETDFIVNCRNRNDYIARMAEKCVGNTLIIVDRLSHGDNLMDSLNVQSKFYIKGESDVEKERSPIIALLERSEGNVVVAIAKVFSTGINVKNLHNLIFASSGKSDTKIVQSVGRTLRKHPSKQMAYIFDVCDNTRYSLDHLEERKRIYEEQKINFTFKQITL